MSNESVRPVGADAQQQASIAEVLTNVLALAADLPQPITVHANGDNHIVLVQLASIAELREWAAAVAANPVATQPHQYEDGPREILANAWHHTWMPGWALNLSALDPAEEPAVDQPWFDADAPRTWRWENEADRVEPEGVTEVIDESGAQWRPMDSGLWHVVVPSRGGDVRAARPWSGVLATSELLTEVVPPAQSKAGHGCDCADEMDLNCRCACHTYGGAR